MNGERVIAPGLAVVLNAGENPLTERERETLSASTDGGTIEGIARQLYLSEKRPGSVNRSTIKKLVISNRVEAAKTAERKGWL